MIARVVKPLQLESFPVDDPRAIRANRSLRRINALARNAAIVAEEGLRPWRNRSACQLVQIGAGDGAFMLSIAKKAARLTPRARVMLVDNNHGATGKTLEAIHALGWQAQTVNADPLDWLMQSDSPVFDVVFANMYLFRFEETRLTRLLSEIAKRTYRFVACEPRRARHVLASCALLRLLACDKVARSDAAASVQAGFRDRELSRLWPQSRGWRVREEPRGMFSHCFVASSGRFRDEASGYPLAGRDSRQGTSD